MIIYLKNGEIDREQWDNCIRNSSCVKPYPFSWYLDIVSPGWEALVDDEYDSVFPLPVAGRLGLKYLSSPLLLSQVGAFSPDKPGWQVLDEFLQYIPEFYRLVDLTLFQKTSEHSFRISEKSFHELDLSSPYEKLREGFEPHTRRSIESSRKKETGLVSDISPEEFIDLLILTGGKKLRDVKPFEYQRLRQLINFCTINRKGRLTGTRNGRGKLISGVFIIELKGSVTIVASAESRQGVEKKADYLALDEIIMKHAGTRTILEFPGTPFVSCSSLAASVGAEERRLYHIHRNRLFLPSAFFR